MMNVMKDRGVIIVTHRLALAKTVDLIAVMRDGGIVGLGSHEELMEIMHITGSCTMRRVSGIGKSTLGAHRES